LKFPDQPGEIKVYRERFYHEGEKVKSLFSVLDFGWISATWRRGKSGLDPGRRNPGRWLSAPGKYGKMRGKKRRLNYE
jgi:hypothetical protein